MSSPFPGMDPYLEGVDWADFHHEFIGSWRAALLRGLPPGYSARIQERAVLIEPPEVELGSIFPDVSVLKVPPSAHRPFTGALAHATATIHPVEVSLPSLPEEIEHFIEIRTRTDEKLVSVLELLSPSNKRGTTRTQYLNKRAAVIRANANLVEIDLLLGGRRLPMRGKLPAGDHYALVSRAPAYPQCSVYAWSLPHVLPRIPIPLEEGIADIEVDLAAIFADAYSKGPYSATVRYNLPPEAPIPPVHVDWVQSIASATR